VYLVKITGDPCGSESQHENNNRSELKDTKILYFGTFWEVHLFPTNVVECIQGSRNRLHKLLQFEGKSRGDFD
jgi:hypothetical protein